jgi:hypothetical protein
MKHHYDFPDNRIECWDSEGENAYHEAGHITIAAACGLELLPRGILIYEKASASKALLGHADYRDGDLDDLENRKHVLIALIAGVGAQDRQFPETQPHWDPLKSDCYTFLELLKMAAGGWGVE